MLKRLMWELDNQLLVSDCVVYTAIYLIYSHCKMAKRAIPGCGDRYDSASMRFQMSIIWPHWSTTRKAKNSDERWITEGNHIPL